MFDGIDPLSELRDIHEPAASWWLVSPTGWLLALALVVAGFGLWRWWRAHVEIDPQRAALVELNGLRRRQVAGEAAGSLVAELASLLRRVALATHPRAAVAGLCGQAWIEFLDGRPGPGAVAAAGSRDFAWAPYCRDPDVDVARLLVVSESLIASLVARRARALKPATSTGRRGRRPCRHLAPARRRIRTACLADDADGARRALLQWGELAWPAAPGSGLTAMSARFGDRELSCMLADLEQALYAPDAGPWQGRALWCRLRGVLKPALDSQLRGDRLPPLYE